MPRPHVRRLKGEIAPGVRLRRTLKVHVERCGRQRWYVVSTTKSYPYCEWGEGATVAAALADFGAEFRHLLDSYAEWGRDRLSPQLRAEYDWCQRNLLVE